MIGGERSQASTLLFGSIFLGLNLRLDLYLKEASIQENMIVMIGTNMSCTDYRLNIHVTLLIT